MDLVPFLLFLAVVAWVGFFGVCAVIDAGFPWLVGIVGAVCMGVGIVYFAVLAKSQVDKKVEEERLPEADSRLLDAHEIYSILFNDDPVPQILQAAPPTSENYLLPVPQPTMEASPAEDEGNGSRILDYTEICATLVETEIPETVLDPVEKEILAMAPEPSPSPLDLLDYDEICAALDEPKTPAAEPDPVETEIPEGAPVPSSSLVETSALSPGDNEQGGKRRKLSRSERRRRRREARRERASLSSPE